MLRLSVALRSPSYIHIVSMVCSLEHLSFCFTSLFIDLLLSCIPLLFLSFKISATSLEHHTPDLFPIPNIQCASESWRSTPAAAAFITFMRWMLAHTTVDILLLIGWCTLDLCVVTMVYELYASCHTPNLNTRIPVCPGPANWS